MRSQLSNCANAARLPPSSIAPSSGTALMSYRRLLRDLSRWRLPPGDEVCVRVLLKQVVRAPAGDDVLPAALCASLCKTYSTLQPPGRLGVISILAAFGARDDIVQRAAESLVQSKGRDTAPRLQVPLHLRTSSPPHPQHPQRPQHPRRPASPAGAPQPARGLGAAARAGRQPHRAAGGRPPLPRHPAGRPASSSLRPAGAGGGRWHRRRWWRRQRRWHGRRHGGVWRGCGRG